MDIVDINFSNLSDIEYEYLFKTVISTHEYVFFKDTHSRFTYLNDALLSSFNETKIEDVIGKTDYDYYPKKFADRTFIEEQKIINENCIIKDKEEKLIQANGDVSWYKASKYPLLNKNGNIIGIWGISSNIDNQKRVKRELEETKNAYQTKSEIDQTTGLKNKRKMYEDLKFNMSSYAKSKRKDDIFCIAFMDLDNFKYINDTYGHNTGDLVLKQVALLIESAVRPIDSVYRFGGDEFVIIYKGINLEQSILTTKRIVNIINSHIFKIDNKEITSSISAGIASCEESHTVDKIINLSDSRLYNAKISGKNTVAPKELNANIKKELEL